MNYKILLTSTSFQDTPGAHHDLLNQHGFEIDKMRGPLKENVLLEVISQYDGIICGDDEITRNVIKKGSQSKLRIISKYGIGLDKVDLNAASEFGVPVTNCPGVNQVTVAEHVFALLLSYIKNIIPENEVVQQQKWDRLVGRELNRKIIGVVGTGNVGKEVIKRAVAFGMKVVAFDKFISEDFAKQYDFHYTETIEELLSISDVISLNLSLNESSRNMISKHSIGFLKQGVVIVNTARAGLVDQDIILKGIENGIIGGYLTDVLEEEPIVPNHPFLGNKKILITPHIGSRTYENVVNQGTMAVENLLKHI